MSFEVIRKTREHAVVFATANSSLTVTGSNTDINVSTETIDSVSIAQIWSSASAGGYWKVQRGSNTIVVIDKSCFMDFEATGIVLDKDKLGTLDVSLHDSSVGSITIRLKKKIKVPTAVELNFDLQLRSGDNIIDRNGQQIQNIPRAA